MAAIQKLAGNFTEADIDDEIILMRRDNGELLTMDETAAVIWRLIDGNRDRAGLAKALEAEFDADKEQIASDVSDLLLELREAGLIAER